MGSHVQYLGGPSMPGHKDKTTPKWRQTRTKIGLWKGKGRERRGKAQQHVGIPMSLYHLIVPILLSYS